MPDAADDKMLSVRVYGLLTRLQKLNDHIKKRATPITLITAPITSALVIFSL